MAVYEPWALDACLVGVGASFIAGMGARLCRVALSHHRLQRVPAMITTIESEDLELRYEYEINAQSYASAFDSYWAYIIPRCFIRNFSAMTRRLRQGTTTTCWVDVARPRFGVLNPTGLLPSVGIIFLSAVLVALVAWYAARFLSIWEWAIGGIGGFLIGTWYYWSWPSNMEVGPRSRTTLFHENNRPER